MLFLLKKGRLDQSQHLRNLGVVEAVVNPPGVKEADPVVEVARGLGAGEADPAAPSEVEGVGQEVVAEVQKGHIITRNQVTTHHHPANIILQEIAMFIKIIKATKMIGLIRV